MKRPIAYFLAAFAAGLAVACVHLWPVATDLDGTLLGGAERGGAGCPAGLCADGTGTVRDYWAAEAQGTTAFGWTRDELNGAPEGIPRAPSIAVANAFQPGLILALHGAWSWVASWNVFLLLGFAATAATMFVFLERLGASLPAAAFGAYAFAFGPFALEKALAGQAAFVHAWVFPLVALAFLRLRKAPSRGTSLLLGVAVAAAFYVHTYFGLVASLEAAVLAGAHLLEPEHASRGRRQRLALLGLSAGTLAVLLAPAAVLWLVERDTVGQVVANTSADVERLGATIPAYLLPWHRNPLLGDVTLWAWDPNESGEPTLFYGYVTLGLAVAAVVILRRLGRREFVVTAAAGCVVLGFLFSLPRTLDVAGVPIPTPSLVVSEVFPFIRAFARFGVLAGFGLATLAALGLTELMRRRGRLVPAVALAVLALELASVDAFSYVDASRPPAHAEWLRAAPRGAVASYPTVSAEAPVVRLAEEEFFNQRFHHQPLYTLWAGSVGGTREHAIRILSRNLGDEATAGILAAEGVRYAVVHDDVYRALRQTPPRPDKDGFRLVTTLGDVRIFAVRAEPADLEAELDESRVEVAIAWGLEAPAVAYGRGFYAPEPYRERRWRWVGDDATLAVENRAGGGTSYLFNALAFSDRRTRAIELVGEDGRVLAKATVPTSEAELKLGPFPLPDGRSLVRIRTDPPAERLAPGDERVASVFMSPIAIHPLADYSRSLRASATGDREALRAHRPRG